MSRLLANIAGVSHMVHRFHKCFSMHLSFIVRAWRPTFPDSLNLSYLVCHWPHIKSERNKLTNPIIIFFFLHCGAVYLMVVCNRSIPKPDVEKKRTPAQRPLLSLTGYLLIWFKAVIDSHLQCSAFFTPFYRPRLKHLKSLTMVSTYTLLILPKFLKEEGFDPTQSGAITHQL